MQNQDQSGACQEPAAWIKRARDRKLAMPICPELLGTVWIAAHGLMPLADQPALIEQLWLLLPGGGEHKGSPAMPAAAAGADRQGANHAGSA